MGAIHFRERPSGVQPGFCPAPEFGHLPVVRLVAQSLVTAASTLMSTQVFRGSSGSLEFPRPTPKSPSRSGTLRLISAQAGLLPGASYLDADAPMVRFS